MSPRPSTAAYKDYYAEAFWREKLAKKTWRDGSGKLLLKRLFGGMLGKRLRRQGGRLPALVRMIGANTGLGPGGRVLDIGCAFGVIGAGLRVAFGCEVFGVEPNSIARRIAETENAIRVLADSAEKLGEIRATGARFDLVLLSNVLENILDPVAILRDCRELLADRGMVCVHTPNVFFYDAMNPFHPYIFSPETLARLLERADLNVHASIYADHLAHRVTEGAGEHKFLTVFAKAHERGIERHRAKGRR